MILNIQESSFSSASFSILQKNVIPKAVLGDVLLNHDSERKRKSKCESVSKLYETLSGTERITNKSVFRNVMMVLT